MINIYVITLKDKDNKKIFYTSKNALYTAHAKEIGITIQRLYVVFGEKSIYENRRVIIEKVPAYNISDVNDNVHIQSI